VSASEKLKALDTEMPPNLTPEIYPGNPLIALRNALPQIVAVVEAAENPNALRGDLDRALAALNEALS
jgi:hypothetical protein